MSEHGSKTLTVSFVWATFGISLARPKWFPVAIGDHGRNLVISLWPRDNANIKNSECKNPLEKFSPRFFWDQDGILLIDYLPKGQTITTRYYSSLLVVTGHLQPRRNWPTWAFNVFRTHPILQIGPVGIPPVPWTENTTERSPFFVQHGGYCRCGDLVGWTTFWFFFWVACKS